MLPILEKSCTKCHNPKQKMGRVYRPRRREPAGGASGPVIAPGVREQLVVDHDPVGQDALGGVLSKANQQTLQAYIEQGRFPEDGAGRT
ncbi:MAG: hypothetical protein IPJ98_28530 [Bryobacterales bacterium]|nr:hypothetical protein [Bryobacterales bacterium]